MAFYLRSCSLCGGKLNGMGICTECGLNNERNSEKNYRINQNVCDDEPMTHVHTTWEEEKPSDYGRTEAGDMHAYRTETHPVSASQKQYDLRKAKAEIKKRLQENQAAQKYRQEVEVQQQKASSSTNQPKWNPSPYMGNDGRYMSSTKKTKSMIRLVAIFYIIFVLFGLIAGLIH